MKKLKLALDYKVGEEDKKKGITPEFLTMHYFTMVHDKKYERGGQTKDQAMMWARFLDECYDKDGKLKPEVEVSDEKLDMIKELVNKSEVPIRLERVMMKISEHLETIK